MKEYSFIDSKREYINNEFFVNTYCFYWEKQNDQWIRKHDIFENKDYYFYIDKSELYKTHTMIDVNLRVYPNAYRTISGKECIKIEPVEKLTAEQFRLLRDRFSVTYESDIPALTRWIANNKPKYSKQVRKLYLDIETIKENGNYSNPQEAIAPIILITCYDSFTEEYVTFSYKESEKSIVFKNEVEMLKGFIRYLRKINPDYILGWNIESYDIPYLINRLKNLLGEDAHKSLSMFNHVTYRQNNEINAHKYSSFYILILGLGIFDLMVASQRLWLGKYCGYSLNKMSGYHLKENKIEVEDINKLFEEDFEKLVEYNIKDVELCVKLDDKLEIFKKFQSFQDIMSINVHNALVQSQNIVQYLLQNTNIVLLNSNHKAERKTYQGGFVLDSISGIFEKCYKFDFVSMYPTIMITYNISPETILSKPEENSINMDNKYFFKKEKGAITKITEELYKKRLIYKKLGNEDLSRAYKLLMNSIYGQFAAPYSRIYNLACGEAITYQGRRMITKLALEINKLDGKIILGDTDSIIFHSKDKDFDKEIILRKFDEILEEIYKQDNISENKLISLELEKEIEKLIIFKNGKGGIKKKYIEYSNGKIKNTGLDSIKSDTQEIAKDLQNELVECVLNNPTRNEIKKIIERYHENFLDALGRKKYKYIGIPSKLNKDIKLYKTKTFSLKAIENSKINISVNEQFYILMLKDGPFGFKNMSDFKYINLEIDKEYMWDRITKKAEIFLDLFPSEQKTLGEFK